MTQRRSANIYTIDEFIDMIHSSVFDDDVIVWTQNTGVIKYSKKYKSKVVDFSFAAEAFDLKNGINDLLQDGTILFCAFGCPKKLLSKEAKQLLLKNNSNE